MAGVTHDDIDMAMVYDSFTITVLETLEDLGFCEKGEGGDFVSGGRLQAGAARCPSIQMEAACRLTTPACGAFSCCWRPRGSCGIEFEGTPRQVPDCKIALCHGTGGALGSRHSGGTVILGRD